MKHRCVTRPEVCAAIRLFSPFAISHFTKGIYRSHLKLIGSSSNTCLRPCLQLYSPKGTCFPALFTLLFTNGNMHAAGNIKNANGNPCVAKWNGTNWNEVGGNSTATPLPNGV